jgi:aspartate kinase
LPLLVQKFGGTSVADSSKILAAARRAIQAHHRGEQVLIVVSARGKTTDELIALAKEITETPPAREMDMLLSTGEQVSVALMAMAIESLGVPAISFTGAQIGLVTDSFHTKARIRNISSERMVQALGEGKIVIVAGFQGVDEHYNITTLGRGGSDTTAVALAAVLGAGGCEIYTDVDGVYTTDPRIVPEARKIDRISYDEMLELASLGAGVMHSRSIEFAKKYGVPIHVRSSFSDAPGTWIVGEHDARRLGVAVTGAALAKDEARITILGVPDRPGVVHSIFRTIAAANIVVDMIVQNVATGGTTEVSFTVAKGDLAETLRAAEAAAKEIGASAVTHDAEVAKISVVGLGMRTHTGVATAMFDALAADGINIQMITTSEIKISVLVHRASAVAALRTVHKAFLLDQLNGGGSPFTPSPPGTGLMKLAPLADSDTVAGEGRTLGMEDLVIAGVELDESQARIALFHVPDRPGYAARVFRAIADAGVFVDMIVQNIGIAGDSVLSFTVPRDATARAVEAVRAAGVADVSVEPAMAKLSVIGVGMRTHTGVATRMFAALADRGINVNLINTSEVRINVGTDVARGQEGLECLKRAFALE